MKYAVFSIMVLCGVPVMAWLAATSERWRSLLLVVLLFSPALGDTNGINFMSMENYRGPDRGFEVTLTDLVAWSFILAMLARHASRIRWWPYNSTPMLLLFLLALTGSVQAPEPVYCAFTLFKLLRLFAVYWAVVNILRAGIDLQWIWTTFVIIGLKITFQALKQKYVDHYYRVPGPFEHSNTIPLYLNLILPYTLVWTMCQRRLTTIATILGFAAVVGMLFVIVATGSRAGMVLSAMGIMAAMALGLTRNLSGRTVGISAIMLCGLMAGGLKAADSIRNRFENAPDASAEARVEFNVAAAMMSRDHSLGVGINLFSYTMSNTPRYRKHLKVMAVEKKAGVAHHIYWLTAAELGYVGLGVFLVVVLRFLGLALRRGWRAKTLEQKLLAAAAIGYVLLHLQGLYEWALRITPVSYQFVLMAGIVVHLADLVSTNRSRPEAIDANPTKVEARSTREPPLPQEPAI